MNAICYNASQMIRALALAAAVVTLPAVANADLPRPVTATSSAAAASSTAGDVVATTPSSGMRPGIPPPPKAKHPYFFAAYAAVWAGIFAYAFWLGSRISSLEKRAG